MISIQSFVLTIVILLLCFGAILNEVVKHFQWQNKVDDEMLFIALARLSRYEEVSMESLYFQGWANAHEKERN